ncbi:hypothetical protein KI387_027541, partial [Taxus chinensis]
MHYAERRWHFLPNELSLEQMVKWCLKLKDQIKNKTRLLGGYRRRKDKEVNIVVHLVSETVDIRKERSPLQNPSQQFLLSSRPSYRNPVSTAGTISSDGAIYIDCNDSGVEFIEAGAEHLSIADLATPDVTPAVEELFVLHGAVTLDNHRLSLLVVQ